MSEFLTIQVGQCGNQIGGSFWPSILSEYNIDLNKNLHYKDNSLCNYWKETDTSFSSFFDISKSRNEVQTPFSNLSDLISNNVKARVMCIDAENSVVSRFSNSELKHLFDVKSFITSYSGSGNNWAEGYYTHGRKFKNKILKNITRFAERCDSLHGFLFLYSCGGGTGSGLGSYILELLEDNFSNIERFVACVYPTGSEDIITAPFNMMLATQHLMQHATCVFPVENRALQDISDKKKVASTNRFKKLTSIFGDMNSIVVDLLLHITSGSRFSGQLNFDMNEINSNMIPYPQLNFLASSYSPLCSNGFKKDSMVSLKETNFWNVCSRNNQMLKIDPMDPYTNLVSGMLFGRGDYSLTDMRKYVLKLQRKAPFLEWSKKCIKVGLCAIPPNGYNHSMMSLFNTSSITSLFDNLSEQFSKLFNRKAHVHHYTKIPGFEYDHFLECQNSICDITEFYKNIKSTNSISIPRLESNIYL